MELGIGVDYVYKQTHTCMNLCFQVNIKNMAIVRNLCVLCNKCCVDSR